MGAACGRRSAPAAPETTNTALPSEHEPMAAAPVAPVTEAPTELPFREELKGHLFFFLTVSCACFVFIHEYDIVGSILAILSLILWFGAILQEKDKDRKRSSGVIVKYIVMALTHLLMLLVLIAAFKAGGILKIKDPATSVRGIGIQDLGEHIKRDKPNAHDVVLNNGFVRVDWAGSTRETRIDCGQQKNMPCDDIQYTAAPIYKDMKSASGPPLAWAVKFETVPAQPLHPSYCAGAGLCGFYKGVLERSRSRQFIKAADDSAKKGGFAYRDGLPKLEMVNVLESVKRLDWWYLHFWTWFGLFTALQLTSVLCIFLTRFLTKEHADETLPLM
mmetsp:Transcript_145748/g.279444  ORF Transcript_145748/g.279444 Transcript_145748/m.279444 type:complete len:332 (+) Transcript_145748:106-1101(+)